VKQLCLEEMTLPELEGLLAEVRALSAPSLTGLSKRLEAWEQERGITWTDLRKAIVAKVLREENRS
jgi:hypothetical protein